MKSVFQMADDVTRTMSAHSMKYLQDTQPQKNNRMDQWHKWEYIDRRTTYVFAVSFKYESETKKFI